MKCYQALLPKHRAGIPSHRSYRGRIVESDARGVIVDDDESRRSRGGERRDIGSCKHTREQKETQTLVAEKHVRPPR